MAHLVESMAYVGQTPWHGLGKALPAQQSLDVWAEAAGMNWEILSSPVCFRPDAVQGLSSIGIHSYPERSVLYRSDTQAPLSVVGQRYQVVQPREILAFYRDLTEVSGFELETAGVLKGGRKLWALARTGQSTVLKGKDETRGYVLLATACDGTLATTAQFTSIRVVCNNTLAIALGDQQGCVKVPHSTTFDAEAVKKELGISVSSWDAFMYRMKHLSERQVGALEARRFVERVFLPDEKKAHHSPKAQERAMGQVLELFGGKGQGSELNSAKDTAYGLLNAVTEYVDHSKRARSTDYRLDSAWFGPGATLKQRALDEVLLMVA